MSRSPWPSRWALAVELVMASTSPVPKIPRPVSYFQTAAFRPLPAAPPKVAEKVCFHEVVLVAAAEGLLLKVEVAAGAEAERAGHSTRMTPAPATR